MLNPSDLSPETRARLAEWLTKLPACECCKARRSCVRPVPVDVDERVGICHECDHDTDALEWCDGDEPCDRVPMTADELSALLATLTDAEGQRDGALKAVSHLSQAAHLEWTRAELALARQRELETALEARGIVDCGSLQCPFEAKAERLETALRERVQQQVMFRAMLDNHHWLHGAAAGDVISAVDRLNFATDADLKALAPPSAPTPAPEET